MIAFNVFIILMTILPGLSIGQTNTSTVINKLLLLNDQDLLKVLLNQKELLGGSSSKCKIKYHPYASFKYSFEYFDGSNVISETFGTRGISYQYLSFTSYDDYNQNIINGVSTLDVSYNARNEIHDYNNILEIAGKFRTLLMSGLWPCGEFPLVEVKNRTPQGLLSDIKFISSNQNEVKCLSSIHPYEEEVLLPSQVCSFFYKVARETPGYVITLSQEANLSDPDKLSLSNATLKSEDPITFGTKKILVAPVCGEDFLHTEVRRYMMDFAIWQTYQANAGSHLNNLNNLHRRALFNFYTAYKRSKNGISDPLPFCDKAKALGASLEGNLDFLHDTTWQYPYDLYIGWDPVNANSLNSKMWIWKTPTNNWVNNNKVDPTTTEILDYPTTLIISVIKRYIREPSGCNYGSCWYIQRRFDP